MVVGDSAVLGGDGRIEIDVHGSGPAAEREIDGGHREVAVQWPEPQRCLGHGRHHRNLIDALMRHPLALAIGNAVGDQNHRLPIEQSLGGAVHRACGAGSTRHDTGAWRSGQLGGHAGHDRCGGLGVHQHESNAGRFACADDIEVRAASGHAEQQLGAG